jgi:hypothetical protein
MSKNAIIAEAIRELAEGQDQINEKVEAQNALLASIRDVLVDLTDGLSEHRAHTMQDVSDLGATVRDVKSRLVALERVAGRD